MTEFRSLKVIHPDPGIQWSRDYRTLMGRKRRAILAGDQVALDIAVSDLWVLYQQ
jgi:hypothetical protein